MAICGGLVKVAKSRPSKVAAPQKCAVGVCEEGPEAEQMGDEGIGDSRLLELGVSSFQFIAGPRENAWEWRRRHAPITGSWF